MTLIFPVDALFTSGRTPQLRGERLLQNMCAPCRKAVEQQNAKADMKTETRAIFKSRKERFWPPRFHAAESSKESWQTCDMQTSSANRLLFCIV